MLTKKNLNSKKILTCYQCIILLIVFLPIFVSSASPTGGGNAIENPIESPDFQTMLDRFFQKINPVVALIATFFVFLSGFKFLTAQGEPKKLGEARQMLITTLIGVAIVVGAQLIIKIIKDIIL